MSATVTTLDQKIVPYIKNICKRDPFSGKVVTGGIVTVKDSNWLLSSTFNRQPQFRTQPKDQLVGWIYGLFSDKPGNYVKKPIEIVQVRKFVWNGYIILECQKLKLKN